MTDLAKSVVRIEHAQQVLGVGFVVRRAKTHVVLTCAHVLANHTSVTLVSLGEAGASEAVVVSTTRAVGVDLVELQSSMAAGLDALTLIRNEPRGDVAIDGRTYGFPVDVPFGSAGATPPAGQREEVRILGATGAPPILNIRKANGILPGFSGAPIVIWGCLVVGMMSHIRRSNSGRAVDNADAIASSTICETIEGINSTWFPFAIADRPLQKVLQSVVLGALSALMVVQTSAAPQIPINKATLPVVQETSEALQNTINKAPQEFPQSRFRCTPKEIGDKKHKFQNPSELEWTCGSEVPAGKYHVVLDPHQDRVFIFCRYEPGSPKYHACCQSAEGYGLDPDKEDPPECNDLVDGDLVSLVEVTVQYNERSSFTTGAQAALCKEEAGVKNFVYFNASFAAVGEDCARLVPQPQEIDLTMSVPATTFKLSAYCNVRGIRPYPPREGADASKPTKIQAIEGRSRECAINVDKKSAVEFDLVRIGD